ncbi:unnamed protein product [Arctia plantaginis]|uniref:Uncharacterized protein n=1 Tax=Arctia plantaginis TaxID=874455 RepID=A0A8S1AZE9_ARCPL|nr:unnamed protein product [Arctia plantaginis]
MGCLVTNKKNQLCYEEIPSRRINTETGNSDDGNCVCYPGGQSLMPELSNLQANGLERLVVYLYKNENTNEVYVFQPSAEKQSLIPDIPYTSGDSIKPVTTETIVSLFSNYPNNLESQQPVSTQGGPIGLNIGIVHPETKPNWAFTGFPKIKDLNTQIPNKEYVIPSQSPHLGRYRSQHQQFKPSAFKLIEMEPNPSSNFDDSLAQADVIVDTDPKKDTWLYKEKENVISLNSYQNKATIQSVKPQIDYNIHEAEVNLPKRLSTFDDWYKEQMETVQNQKISKTNKDVIDSDGLKPLVLKTLFDNNIHIGAKGMMIDDSGTPIDLSNLELRPILIGSAVNFQALELNPQLTFPETLPYLEGILIMLIHPFKILGVIPVGKTYVSSPGETNNPSLKYAYKNSNRIDTKTVTSFSKIPLFADLQTQATIKSTNPFKLLERPVSSEPSVFSVNHKLPETLVLKPLDSEQTKFPNLLNPLPSAVEEPFILSSGSQSYDANKRVKETNSWNSLSNLKLDYQSPDGQISHLKNSLIKSNLDVNNKWNLAPSSALKQYSSFDISTLGNDNPHLTVFPLNDKVASQFKSNINAPNIIAFPINSHVGSTSNPLIKGPSLRQEYSPRFNNKYLTIGPDIEDTVDSSFWSSFSNSGWAYNNGYPSAQPLAHQQSPWTNGWGDAIIKSIPSVLNSEATGIKISNLNNLDGSQNQPLAEGDTPIGSTRRFSNPVIKGVLKTLIQMVIDNLVNTKNQEGGQQKKHETETSEVKVNHTLFNPNALKLAGNEDGDGPDYRIIGGSAATGSGSPLSNKGRSGLGII